MSATDPRETAIRFLLATRLEDAYEVERLRRELAGVNKEQLSRALADDRSRLAFWIDLYNAAVQQQPHYDFTDWNARLRFFRRPVLTIAGQAVSLDDIEHGILRRSRLKLGLGYVTNPLPSRFERRFRVGTVDARIHFALNCAAASCPPIAAYRTEQLDEQLDLATRGYLRSSVSRGHDGIAVPAVLLWFIGDFGGPPGMRRFLRDHGIDGWGDRVRFTRWDWTPAPGRWAPERDPTL